MAASAISPERRIESNPYDSDAWTLLLREYQARPIEQARDFYEKLIGQFPNAGRYWKAYIEHELRAKNFSKVEELFNKCLVHILNIDLWKTYVFYVRETKGHVPSLREQMAKAYDFALEKVGLDLYSYSIYSDYISFLKTVPATGQYAENQRISAIRRVFQRGIVIPMVNIEQLWSEYCAYEKSINATLAEKLISEKNKDYQLSKRTTRTMEHVCRGLNRQTISVPPRGTATEMKQVELWKKYIGWEKENPTETEEYSGYAKRVIYAYEQALLCLGFYPDIWYECAQFMQQAAKTLEEKGDVKSSQQMTDDIIKLYERAIGEKGLQKESQLLYFAYADYLEERMQFNEVKDVYNKVLEIKTIDPTLTYIQLMKMVRRTEGVQAMRLIFKRARGDERSRFHVYIAAALFEYYCSKEKDVAIRIFDLGLKTYGNEPEFCLAYVDFLTHLNEDNNTRVVFERILTSGSLSDEKSQILWDRYLEFESLVGDLTSTLKVDVRRRAARKSEDSQTLLLIDRYRFLDLNPCTPDQLILMGYKKLPSAMIQAIPSGSISSKPLTQPVAASAVMGGSAINGAIPVSVRMDIGGYPCPDTDQMIPFKPKPPTTTLIQTYPGGVFAPPPAIQSFIQILPPPWTFYGPFVDCEQLFDKLIQYEPRKIAGIDIDTVVEVTERHGSLRTEEARKELQMLLNTTPDPHMLIRQQLARRRIRGGAGSDSDDEGDIYKKRMKQQNKLGKT
ncbi:unnamed protein product, partial [Mesorhabditis belari]|uniref:Suppressor of forked domain-containing protein n=1 Tax=Mesorhabditis belari TaxID=2138241 RepID=A0AAF3EET4_9BILA